jgi:dipeptidyl aminopeptidase/acylaminoacyl peptidase
MTKRMFIGLAVACAIGPGSYEGSYVGSRLSGAISAQTRRPLQPDDIFQLKSVGDPRISPDGAWVAYTVSTLDRKEDSSDTDVYMVAASGGAPIRLTSSKKPENAPRWSPDGRYLAFLSARDGKKPQVFLLDRRGGDAQAITDYKTGASAIAWSPDSSKLALLVSDPDPNDPETADPSTGSGQAASTASGQAPSTGSGQGASSGSGQGDSKKPKPHVITRLQFMRDGEGYLNDVKRHLHVFDIATKKDLQLTSDRYDDGAPAWAPDGSLIAFSANRTDNPDANDNSDIYVIESRAGAKPRALTASPGSDGSPVFSPDSKSIAYLTGGDSKDIWYATNNVAVVPVTGGAPKILTTGLDRNVSRPQFSPDGSSVLFLLEEGGNSHLARVPSAGGAIARVLNGERDILAFDAARTGDIAVLDTQTHQPAEIFLLRSAGLSGPRTGGAAASAPEALRRASPELAGSADERRRETPALQNRVSAVPPQLTHVNDDFLAQVALGAVERFKAKSADGTMIDAYLTRPPNGGPNAPAGKLPTILRIHGGPVAQYSTGFNLEWQMLAARGFAVVAANPRGSSGYGRDFSRAIWADWGNKDYDDVMAAVDTAIAMGVADPDRLGVGGWSYGGILTDHVISKTTRFKAAVSGASEFNYLANYGTDHYQRQWEAELGLPWQNTALWIKLSPFYRLDKIVTPTLVIGGDLDMNVPILGGQQLYQGLRRLGRETELVIYPGENHSIRRPSFQQDRFERYIAWYTKYLKPAGKTSSQ